MSHTFAQLCHYSIFSIGHSSIIYHRVVIGQFHSINGSLSHSNGDLGTATECLGGDASAVETRAAKFSALYQSHTKSATGSGHSGLIAAGAGSDDYNIMSHVSYLA